jgi:hypothetical protein
MFKTPGATLVGSEKDTFGKVFWLRPYVATELTYSSRR